MTDYLSHSEISELVNSTCDSLGIPHVAWRFSSRFTRKMGEARIDTTKDTRLVRFSKPLWTRATVEERKQVIIHEVCHIAAFAKSGRKAGHGPVWRALMIQCGRKPERCHNVDRTGLVRKHRGSQPVTCGCPGRTHNLGPRRSAKLRQGLAIYTCRQCRQTVKFATPQSHIFVEFAGRIHSA